MSCIPASHSMNAILSQVDSQMDESSGQRRGSKAYQIFPEVDMDDNSDYPDDFLYRRERLPSIVVEPTECSEQESEGPPWPLYPLSKDEEGEDSGAEPAEGATDGEHLEDMQEGSSSRKSSIVTSQSQLSLSRLTPPASPAAPEAAPPCLRS
ncbi:hypothetical protein FQA47_020327 [Oryzias melastigma]|uniref:LBH domain-containing protein n=1 Tax=Oryzias melastigma TaxID=30732 RepID=A0A834F2K8_ORYME|nr:protein LBH isoform X2 [Oryzias melastigma]KAF6718844.1 hypothetical protein FQA47_020327 [Oryzias melastigma]